MVMLYAAKGLHKRLTNPSQLLRVTNPIQISTYRDFMTVLYYQYIIYS